MFILAYPAKESIPTSPSVTEEQEKAFEVIANEDILPTLSNAELEAISNSVYMLEVYDEWGNSISTGSAFSALTGHTLITNYHVIDGAYSVKAFSEDGTSFNINYLVQYDQHLDLAILQLDGTSAALPTLQFADPATVEKGDNVYTIGSPLGLKNTISTGIISGIWEEDGIEYFQTTAPISPGSSGGVLLNLQGEVIGVTSAGYTEGQNINLAVSVSHIVELYDPDVEPIPFEEFADTAKAHGMEPYNVCMWQNVTTSANYLFHTFSPDAAITRIDKTTGAQLHFDFGGNFINVIGNKMYFVNDNKIYSCSLDGTELSEVVFSIDTYKKPNLDSLYAVKDGLVFGCYDENRYESTFSYYLLPYNKKTPIEIDNMPSTAKFTEDGFYSIEQGYLLVTTFSAPNMTASYFVSTDADPYDAYYANGTLIYSTTDTIFAFDIVTGQTKVIFKTQTGQISLRAFYNGIIYFHIWSGKPPITMNNPLYLMDLSGTVIDFASSMYPVAINFADDKMFFKDGTADTPEENRYGYFCNLDGSELTRID